MQPQHITAILECDKDGTWYYVHIPKQIRDAYKPLENRGAIPITVTVGASTWQASMLPWADGSAQISINKRVREKEGLELGQEIQLCIVPRPRNS